MSKSIELNKLIDESVQIETREYTISGYIDNLDALEQLFYTIQYLGQIGASRVIEFSVDGDGGGRVKISPIETKNQIKPDLESQTIHQAKGLL